MDAVANTSAASCSGTFVTVLSNARYAGAAMCLHDQMQQVNSACPVLLVYNDKAQLPMAQLENQFGRQHLLPVSLLGHVEIRRTHRYPAPLPAGVSYLQALLYSVYRPSKASHIPTVCVSKGKSTAVWFCPSRRTASVQLVMPSALVLNANP